MAVDIAAVRLDIVQLLAARILIRIGREGEEETSSVVEKEKRERTQERKRELVESVRSHS